MRPRSGALVPLLATLLVAAAVGTRAADPVAPTPGADDDDGLGRGAEVFQATCAACHGQHGQGRAGAGVDAGPPLSDLPVSYIDVVLRTGRMPIADPQAGVRVDQLDDRDREAVVAWMRQRFDLPGTIPEPPQGEAARGLEPFVRHCAACHGAGGGGGVAGGGTFVPAIAGLDAVTIVEAVRVGPFEMPAFSEAVIDDRTAADIAAYLDEADEAPRTPFGLQSIDPIGAAVATATVLAIAVWLLRLVARRPRDEGSA